MVWYDIIMISEYAVFKHSVRLMNVTILEDNVTLGNHSMNDLIFCCEFNTAKLIVIHLR